jgi:glycosyltransferase involved in cell wall biosynthesis
MIEPRTPVTILVPIYNGSKHIRPGLDSIAGMSSKYDEILLIDDGSEDDSAIQIKEFARNFENINFISRKHFGLVDTLNFGIRESANKLVARADIDDLYSPNRIQRQVELITSSINFAAVFSDYRFISENHKDLGILPAAVHPDLVQLSLINHQRTAHSSVLFNKDSVIEAGGYIPDDFPAEDLALWIRLSRFSKLSSVPEVLLSYTINPSGITESTKTIMRMKTNTLQQPLLQDLNFDSILLNLNSILDTYSNMPLENLRRALVLRDLLTLSQKTRDSSLARLRDVSRLTRNFNLPALAIPILGLARSMNRRKKFRLVGN